MKDKKNTLYFLLGVIFAGFSIYIGSSALSQYNRDEIWNYIIWCFKKQDFNIFLQLIFPFASGLIGGLASYYIGKADREYDSKKLNGKGSLYIWLGGLAGWLAVNLLNPSGTIGQVSVLGFIAGLSGVTYLKRNALVEAIEEKRMFGVEEIKEYFFDRFGDENDNEIEFNESDFAMAAEEHESIRKTIEEENKKFKFKHNSTDSNVIGDKKG
ncbi:hypothetical protein [Lysinibacillus xylanilyticus]|uniref:Uncharacterized protein n=1 Tax=Lysinibacillus xylanilyticus TaxID=582475 RepID=A0ABV3W027_9BACI